MKIKQLSKCIFYEHFLIQLLDKLFSLDDCKDLQVVSIQPKVEQKLSLKTAQFPVERITF